MSFIDKRILDSVNSYKLFLEQSINGLMNINNNNPNFNYFATGEYKLFSIIAENVRMDLNYLLFLNPDFDFLGFPAIKRNLRISIEAYYDLYNLVSDRSYMDLLKYQSVENSNIDTATINLYQPYIKKKIINIKRNPLSIKEKADISKSKNNLPSGIHDQFKIIATDSNSYIHPNIFIIANNNRDTLLKDLILCDCCLVMYAFELLNRFMSRYPGAYFSTLDPYAEYNKLYNAIAFIPWIYQ